LSVLMAVVSQEPLLFESLLMLGCGWSHKCALNGCKGTSEVWSVTTWEMWYD